MATEILASWTEAEFNAVLVSMSYALDLIDLEQVVVPVEGMEAKTALRPLETLRDTLRAIDGHNLREVYFQHKDGDEKPLQFPLRVEMVTTWALSGR